MSNPSILNSISTIKWFVSELKQTVFRPKMGSFLFLSRSIQRYMELIKNHCDLCSSFIGKNDNADHYLKVIHREIEDIRKIVFNHTNAKTQYLESEEDIYDCFDQIEMNISYLEAMFTQYPVSNSEVSQ